MKKSAPSPVASFAIIAVAYYAFATIGLVLAFPSTNISPVWPPSGLALAIMLLAGKRAWPGILLGAFAANLHAFIFHHHLGGTLAIVASLAIAAGNTLEAVVGAQLLRGKFDPTKLLDRVDNVFRFGAVTMLACSLSALAGTTMHCAVGIVPWSSWLASFGTWWLGDATGVLFVAPVMLMHAVPRRFRWSPSNLLEVPAIIVAIYSYFWFVFVHWQSHPLAHSHEYLIMPLLLWVAFRLGRRVTTLTVFIVCAIAICLTVRGIGPYASTSMNESLLALQLFVALVALTFMVLMASLTERRNALDDLHALAGMLERVVEERTEELTAANEEKNQFLGMAAHDLRSALNGVIGFSDLLAMSAKDVLERRQAGMLEKIRASSRYMLNLVENLLDVSTIEAGRLDLELQTTDISATVERSVELNSLMAATKSIALNFRADGPILVSLDERRFEQVINNMVSNAIKYSPNHRQVEVSVQRSEADVLIVVKDDGLGIAEQDRVRLFQPFTKGRASGTAGERSTGLGLAIAQKIVKRHGGRMWVESEEGRGSTFYVSLPAMCGVEAEPATVSS